jgi:hypothetical protein
MTLAEIITTNGTEAAGTTASTDLRTVGAAIRLSRATLRIIIGDSGGQPKVRRHRRLLTTKTLARVIAAPASMGLRSPAAASGSRRRCIRRPRTGFPC